jgi:hypothetical protein
MAIRRQKSSKNMSKTKPRPNGAAGQAYDAKSVQRRGYFFLVVGSS